MKLNFLFLEIGTGRERAKKICIEPPLISLKILIQALKPTSSSVFCPSWFSKSACCSRKIISWLASHLKISSLSLNSQIWNKFYSFNYFKPTKNHSLLWSLGFDWPVLTLLYKSDVLCITTVSKVFLLNL